jgi:hypothetical protein
MNRAFVNLASLLGGHVSWEATQQWWFGRPFVRGAVNAVVRSQARRLIADLDQSPAARVQARILSRLVRQAHKTHFGRDHDFSRIRDVADFRRLVPLHTPLDLWHAYWPSSDPHLTGMTWPRPATGLAAAADGSRPVPITVDLVQAHRAAVWTGLAFAIQSRPRARLFDGQFLFLGDSWDWSSPAGTALVPPLLRPFALDSGRRPNADGLDDLAIRSCTAPVTVVVGDTGRLLRLVSILKRLTGRDDVREVWPQLTAVLFTRSSAAADRPRLAEELTTRSGDAPVLLLEAAIRPEGPLAVEDPRYGLLRLLPHHGLFFEFVPVDEIHDSQPARHGIEAVEPGVPYAVAVTSPGGLWACLTGWTVRFERRDPPLIHVSTTVLTRHPATFSHGVPPPHPRSGASLSTFPRKKIS